MKLAVLFLEYDQGKYSNSFDVLRSYLDGLKNIDIVYYIIDNSREGGYCVNVSDGIFRIGGDNSSWEFSGWQKGIGFLKENGISYDVVLFVNDAFLAYGWTMLEKAVELDLPKIALEKQSVIGHIDTKEIPMRAMGHDVSSWICSNAFFVPKRALEKMDSLVSVDNEKLNSILDEEYVEGCVFRTDAPLDESYKSMVVKWLTEDWHSKIEINNETWCYFRKKVQAMVNESLLTAKIRKNGIAMRPYFEIVEECDKNKFFKIMKTMKQFIGLKKNKCDMKRRA
jgi:hypothetical protein